MPEHIVTIRGQKATAMNPEGMKAAMPVAEFMAKASPAVEQTGDMVLPDRVKCVLSLGNLSIYVCQMPPHVRCLGWITDDSPRAHGPGTKYADVRIALPYVYILAVFTRMSTGQLGLTHLNECFFRNAPLTSLDDQLFYPALLNVSRWRSAQDRKERPLAWLCTEHLPFDNLPMQKNRNKYVRASITALWSCLWDTNFNRSSEQHEGGSWYGYYRKSVSAVSTIKQWEEQTEKDPLFVLDVPWLNTGHSVKGVAERIARLNGGSNGQLTTAAQVSNVVFQHGRIVA